MSLKHAILGFLNYKPFTGYDLKAVFDTSIQHFWQADQSQIYRTLTRLGEQGFAEVEVVEQDDRPDRKVYSITASGKKELRRWLTTPLTEGKMRHASLVQIFFAGQLDDEEILEIFEHEAQLIRERLTRYEGVPEHTQAYAESVNSPRELYFWMLTLELGFKVAEAELAWMESVIARIKHKDHPTE